MGLYLRSRDLDAITQAANVLSSPLAFGSHVEWLSAVTTLVRGLLGGEAAITYGPAVLLPGRAWSGELCANTVRRFAHHQSPCSGVLRSPDPDFDRGLRTRRATRLDVWSMSDVRGALAPVALEDLPIYDEVIGPTRLLHTYGIATMTELGEAHLAVLSTRDDRWRFGEGARDVFRLLLPAFRAGCSVLARKARARSVPRISDEGWIPSRAQDPRLPSHAHIVARHRLTPREADVAVLLARGCSRAQVAATLHISPHTVRHHTEIVFRKLNIHTRGAVALALLGEC